MKRLLHKFFTHTALALTSVACSCSGDKGSDSPAITEASVESPAANIENPVVPVAPQTEPEPNTAPSISYTSLDSVVVANNSETVNIAFSIDDDSDDVTTSLYQATNDISCGETNINDWTFSSNTTDLSATITWSEASSNVYYLCLVADDGEAKDYLKMDSSFIVLPGDMELWLKADVGVTESSGAIARWDDQSGNGRNFVASSETNKPQVRSASIKAKDTVYLMELMTF